MSTILTINVTNLENANQGFYFFQEPAIYTGGPQVYSNSLWSESLGNYQATGATLTFWVDLQYYAGIQEAHGEPVVGQASGYGSAIRAIDLATASGPANDSVTASINPLGLSMPTNEKGVQPGAFRINTPLIPPPAVYNVGSAVKTNGGVTLSNFVVANPNSHTDCQPILKYYVATGEFTAGTVMDFTQASRDAALCDFTGGHTIINVSVNADGSWSTQIVD